MSKRAAGMTCPAGVAEGEADRCSTGYCWDGVCCAEQNGCTGACQACMGQGGTCAFYNDILSPKAPEDACDPCYGCDGTQSGCTVVISMGGNADWNDDCDTDADACGQNGECDPNSVGDCAYKLDDGDRCAAQDCVEGTPSWLEVWSECINHVCTERSEECQEGYACNENACVVMGACTQDTSCVEDAYFCCQSGDADDTNVSCEVGSCTPLFTQGSSCGVNRHCGDGTVCSDDNICCNERCDSPCQVCDGTGSETLGICGDAADDAIDARCEQTPDDGCGPVLCQQGACQGTAVGTPCGEACRACDGEGHCSETLAQDERCITQLDCSSRHTYGLTGDNTFQGQVVCIRQDYVDGSSTPLCTSAGACESWGDWCVTSGAGSIDESLGQCARFQDGSCQEERSGIVQYASPLTVCDDEDWCTVNDTCGDGNGLCEGGPEGSRCNEHGECVSGTPSSEPGVCNCDDDWTGAYCDVCLRYVDANTPASPGSQNGLSWSTAFDNIQEAVDSAFDTGGTCEVWIATGVYYIYKESREDTLFLRDGVTLYGGFAPGDGFEDRDPTSQSKTTIISGHDSSANTNAAYHAVSCVESESCGEGAVLDGVSIVGGAAVLDDFFPNGVHNQGGGLYVFGAVSPLVRNTVFSGNSAYLRGGAVAIKDGATPTFENCIFSGNSVISNEADTGGGAMSVDTDVPLTTVVLDRVYFTGNASYVAGGALLLDSNMNGMTQATLINVVVAGNTARGMMQFGGGAIWTRRSDVSIVNGTIVNNVVGATTNSQSGALHGVLYSNFSFLNTIIWGNLKQEADITLSDGSSALARHSDIEDACDCSGCSGSNVSCEAYAELDNANIDPPVDPVFELISNNTGQWTSVIFDTEHPYRTTLIDDTHGAAWTEDALIGAYLQPNTDETALYLIVDNGEDWIVVWGDLSGTAGSTDNYFVHHFGLGPTSDCLNMGDSVNAPDSDIEGSPRARSDADPADIGAYELQ